MSLIIKEINLISFGKFQNKVIYFEEGLNVIFGLNEAGKSTIHSFIRGMLFGIERQRGRISKDDMYYKFMPWDNSSNYSGTMDIIWDDVEYRMFRNFHKDNRISIITELKSGTEIDLLAGGKLPFASVLTESLYKSTVSIEQQKVNSKDLLTVEFKKQLGNLTTAKSGDIDAAAAISLLNSKKKRLESKKTQKHLESMQEELKELDSLKLNSDRLMQQIVGLDNAGKDVKLDDYRKQLELLRVYTEEYPRIREKYLQYQECMKQLNLIKERMPLKVKESIKDSDIVADNITKDYKTKDYTTKRLQNLRFLKIVLIACTIGLIWIILMIMLLGNEAALFPGVAGILILFLTAGWLSVRVVKKTLQGKNSNRNNFTEVSYGSELVERIAILKADILQYGRRYTNITEITPNSMGVLESEIRRLKESVTRRMDDIGREQEENRLRKEKLKWELALVEDNLDRLYEKRTQFLELMEEKRKEDAEIQALNLAQEIIQELSLDIYNNFGIQLNHKISEYISFFTGGKYSNLKTDSNFDVKVEFQRRFIPISQLSTGTMEQIYLALRLGVADVFMGNNSVPLIFDDVFAYYDDERLKSVLESLSSAAKRQILIFTCHRREQEMLKNASNCIEI